MGKQLVNTYALLLDTSWYSFNTIEEMNLENICECTPSFTGSACLVTDPEYSLKFKKSPVYFIALDEQPELSASLCDNMDEIVCEMTDRLGRFADPDFNIKASIVLLSGIAYQ